MTLVLAALIAACTPEGSSRQLPELPPLPPRLSVAATEPGEARPLREAIVAFTAADRGEVEVCGCPTTPYGGFSRRAELYRRLGDAQVPFFAVDAGEMLVKGLTGRDEADRQVRATAVLDLAKTAGLDAWAASPVDLLPGGLPFLRERGALAANWNVPAPDGLAPASIVERDGVKLGFIGLAAPAKDVPGVDAVASVRAAMTGTADAWFVLSNADEATNRMVAESVAGLGAVLTTEGDRFDEPVKTSGAPIIEAPSRGRYATVLHLSLGTDPRALELVERGIWKDVALGRTTRTTTADPAARAAMDQEMVRDHKKLTKRSAGRDLAYVEVLPLSADLDGNPVADARLGQFRTELLGGAVKASAAATEGGYASGSACGGCHRDRLASWVFDGHARAMEALEKSKTADNPECVSCHSTGFGRPGGFAAVEGPQLEAFRDVQCEACHGPMKGHDGHNSVHSEPIGESTCRACHDPANSPKFVYDDYRKRISCVRVQTQGRPDDPATP